MATYSWHAGNEIRFYNDASENGEGTAGAYHDIEEALRNAQKFIFIADSGYSKNFAEIFSRYGAMDFAAVPIGHYEPRWFMKMQHANPPEALQMVQDLHATQAVGIHWGTFENLTDESLDDPPKLLATALSEAKLPPEKLEVMTHGETRKLAPH